MNKLNLSIVKSIKYCVCVLFIVTNSLTGTFAQQPEEDFVTKTVADLTRQIAAKPNDDKLYVTRGFIRLSGKREFDEALADADKALQINPKNADAGLLRSSALEKKKTYEDFIKNYRPPVDDTFDPFGDSLSQTESVDILALTAKIAADPKNDALYVERGTLYTRNGNYAQPADETRAKDMEFDAKLAFLNSIREGNRAKALADANKALEINPKNIKAYYLRASVKASKLDTSGSIDDYKQAAKIKSESNIVASIISVNDDWLSKELNPIALDAETPTEIVIKGEQRKPLTGFETVKLAKEFSKTNKQSNVIILDKGTKKYLIYEAYPTENTNTNAKLAETPSRKALKAKSKIPFTYESLKVKPQISLRLLPKFEFGESGTLTEVVEIVDAEGLSLIRKNGVPLLISSKGIRGLFDDELKNGNFDEALKIYKYLDKRNTENNGNDLDVVKITRKTNLSKMYSASDSLKPFVEAEMVRWKYAEGDKTAVRGTASKTN